MVMRNDDADKGGKFSWMTQTYVFPIWALDALPLSSERLVASKSSKTV